MADDLNQIDLFLTRRRANYLASDREIIDMDATTGGDIATTSGDRNLIQAILNRLLTRKGELARLGHPNYGSRLYQLIGELNNSRTRALAEIYIRECLAQEPRIAEIRQVVFAPPSRGINHNVLEMTIAVRPVDLPRDLTIGLSVNLAG